jgi:hypothetical protein
MPSVGKRRQRNNHRLGVVANAALASGGNVHDVITERRHQCGHSHSGLTQHEIAPTLRSRKDRMAALADAFIALRRYRDDRRAVEQRRFFSQRFWCRGFEVPIIIAARLCKNVKSRNRTRIIDY